MCSEIIDCAGDSHAANGWSSGHRPPAHLRDVAQFCFSLKENNILQMCVCVWGEQWGAGVRHPTCLPLKTSVHAVGHQRISCFASLKYFSSQPNPQIWLSYPHPFPKVQGPCSSPGVKADRNAQRQGAGRHASIVMHDWPAAIKGN